MFDDPQFLKVTRHTRLCRRDACALKMRAQRFLRADTFRANQTEKFLLSFSFQHPGLPTVGRAIMHKSCIIYAYLHKIALIMQFRQVRS